ncbi:MAG: hypothetical protein HY951_03410 [Bacteroidia bacterium]|nr:hypothetical protein [Bacteroidia bacterium]
MITSEIMSLNKFKRIYPNCYREYMKIEGDDYSNLNFGIDSLLFSFRIGINIVPVYSDEPKKLLGYRSYIKYYINNKLNIPSGEVSFIEDYAKYKTAEKAEKKTIICALKMIEEKLRLEVI